MNALSERVLQESKIIKLDQNNIKRSNSEIRRAKVIALFVSVDEKEKILTDVYLNRNIKVNTTCKKFMKMSLRHAKWRQNTIDSFSFLIYGICHNFYVIIKLRKGRMNK